MKLKFFFNKFGGNYSNCSRVALTVQQAVERAGVCTANENKDMAKTSRSCSVRSARARACGSADQAAAGATWLLPAARVHRPRCCRLHRRAARCLEKLSSLRHQRANINLTD